MQPRAKSWTEFFERCGHDDSLIDFICEQDGNQGVQTRDPFADAGDGLNRPTVGESTGADLSGRIGRE
ncbi:hypothetical protein C8234_14870 [Paracidovorax avenae]|nr:hypothetical protein C8234_14870 [Paracidovorax avenae]